MQFFTGGMAYFCLLFTLPSSLYQILYAGAVDGTTGFAAFHCDGARLWLCGHGGCLWRLLGSGYTVMV